MLQEYFAKIIQTARDLSAGAGDNGEYVRGQAELICDLVGLGTDDWRDAITALITEEVTPIH